ncbi:MAG: class I SAM-dependent methyltransferase [Nanoarchaeota archaeon]|nr:class I SAM-dependent methyltransferase [Nanoarchaeota archaeon]
MDGVIGLKRLREHYDNDNIVKSYEKLRFSDLAGIIEHDISLGIINYFIKKEKPNLLLEIATGPGRLTKHIKLWNKGVGIDSSERMLKLSKKNVDNSNWKFLKSDINKMPFKENYFDMVITFRLLIHFTNTQRNNSYKKIKKILKKGGLLIFDVGNEQYYKPSLINFLLKGYRLFKSEQKNKLLPQIYNNPATKEQIINELEKNNFDIVKVYGVNSYNSLVLLLLALSKRIKFLSKVIKSLILFIEKNNQSNINKYGTFIVIAKNEKA